MDDSGKEMDCVARRTRRKWDDYYEKCLAEFKRKRLTNDGLGLRDKGVINDSEPVFVDFVVNSDVGSLDGRVVAEEDKNVNGVSKSDDDDEVVVESLNSDEDEFDGVGILKSVKEEYDDDGGVMEIDEDESDDVVISMIGNGNLKNDEDGVLESDEDGSPSILKKGERVDDGDFGVSIEILNDDDDDGGVSIEILNDDGVGILESGEDEDNDIDMLKSGGEEKQGGGGGIVEILESDEDENKAQTEAIEKEHLNGSISVSSEAEDSDESIDMQLSESEPTSDEDDEEEDESSTSESTDGTYCGSDNELVNTDDEGVEAEEKLPNKVDDSKRVHLRQESDFKPKKAGDNELVNTDDEGVEAEEKLPNKVDDSKRVHLRQESDFKPKKAGDNELVNTDDEGVEAEEKLPNKVDDSKRVHLRQENDFKPKKAGTSFALDEEQKSLDDEGIFFSTNSRKESDYKPQKDGKSDVNDKPKSDGGVIFNAKEKSSSIRRSRRLNPDNKADEKINEKKHSLNNVRSFFSTDSRKEESDCDPEKDGKSDVEEKSTKKFCSSFVPKESPSTNDDVSRFFSTPDVKTKSENMMFGIKKSRAARDLDMIKILLDSINSVKQKQYTIDEKALESSLPLKFKFEEEVVPPPEKSEWEKHVDSMFSDLELGLQESETNCSDIPKMENEDVEISKEKTDDSPEAACARGDHQCILDEQIGLVCEFCDEVIMDIKDILPQFHAPTRYKRDRKALYYDEPPSPFVSDIHFEASASTKSDPTSYTYGTVWDLIPGVRNQLYPHQREGFEFMWKNLAGGITIENLSKTLPDEARGCIMSHAPGTGKTRLTIVFLQTFLKMYPSCSPMIIAPRGMLLTWESEFKKWNFNVSFHNLNKKELSGNENAVGTELLGRVGSGALSVDCVRLLKLYSWAMGGSVLGLSYPLFEKLTGENGRRPQHEKIREVLLQGAGLLVLDEGHTPRNENSQIWKVLKNVSTQRRIILSGTPFQNSLQEMCNTLCVANPKFANQIGHRRYGRLTSSFDTNRDEAMELKAILAPFVHVHKGTVLKESLPGIRHTLVFLHPTELQKKLLKTAWTVDNFLRRNRMISLTSVHPSILNPDDSKPDINEGVKTRFLIKLIQLSNALGERVLVFSQFIDSLVFIRKQLEENFSWHAGKEVLYMDGQLEDKRRQDSISSFNDETSEAKVLLASVKACSEGINLTGASRVVLLDTLWNPSVEKQAICRAYRLGQKRVVHVYRLFTTGVEVRLGQFPCQLHKEQVSRWLFSLGEEGGKRDKSEQVLNDKVMEAMLDLESFNNVFDKVIAQPKEADIIKTFGL